MAIRPEISAAVLDAIPALEMAEDGSVSRSALEKIAVRREVFANVALHRYQQDHPSNHLTDGETYNAIEAGLALLAADAIDWLVKKDHLVQDSDGRIRLGAKPLKDYSLGSNREQELFSSLRRITPHRKALIEASIAELGDLREFFPVLLDENGDVVDGRHRLDIDPAWPVSRRRVSREHRLAVAMAANRTNAWSEKDWTRLRGMAEQQHGRQAASRTLARLALLENHERPAREIARLTGASDKTVAAVRAELVETAEFPQFTKPVGGRPRADGTPARPRPISAPRPRILTEEKQTEVDALVSGGATRAEVMEHTGLRENTAQRAMEQAKVRQAVVVPPDTASPEAQEESEHQHDFGPWVRMRQCAECGEQEISQL